MGEGLPEAAHYFKSETAFDGSDTVTTTISSAEHRKAAATVERIAFLPLSRFFKLRSFQNLHLIVVGSRPTQIWRRIVPFFLRLLSGTRG